MSCLNPWDVQSKHVMDVNGVAEALYAGECRYGGGEAYVCYGISRSCLKGGMNAGGMPVEKNMQPTITSNGTGAVCYSAVTEAGKNDDG